MIRTLCRLITIALVITVATILQQVAAQALSAKIGIVVMHGKGGSPTKHVADLASSLENKGYLVTNVEMPWSGRRGYDVNVGGAEKEVESALDNLRAQGATKLFVAGHSQGGLFALYFGNKHRIDGVIAIAPGGNVANPIFQEKLGESVELARKLVAGGKGEEKTKFLDYEGSKGTFPIIATPATYLSWFDPNGAMNQSIAVRSVNPQIPILFIVPKGDYPGLLKVKQSMFNALPHHPLTKLHEPDANHLDAPSASRDEIVLWTTEIANRPPPALQ